MDALGVTAPERSFRIRSRLDTRSRDPLTYWRIGVPRLKPALAMLAADDGIDELALRACNKGTKTETAAAYVLACLQKRTELDGVPLPQWRGKIEAAQFVLDYKQQLLSVQSAYLRLLGGWPHHARYNGEVLSSIHVQPIGGDDDETKWSVLHFLSQENRRSGLGVRADVAAFDEPPAIDVLREMRKASHAGRRGIRLVAFTPTIRRQWADLKAEYGDTPRRSIRRINQDWAEARWSLEDVADWVLSPAEKAGLRRQYKLDPLRDAREHGDYISTEGTCPFYPEILLQMFEDCREPEIINVRVTVEATDQGETRTVARVPIEVFAKPRSGFSYYINVDPASGVDDAQHNPLGLHVYEMGTGDLCARWNGKLAPYSVGVMAAVLARQYNNAFVDIEMKDHWGVNVVRGLQSSHYGNLCYEQRELSPGKFAKEVGFDNNEETKKIIVGQIQQWVLDYGAGVKYGACPSRTVLECLLDCELDADNKVIPPNKGGAHGEDMILKGQSLRQAVTRSSREIPALYTPPKTENQRIAAMIRGEDMDDEREPEQLTPIMERPRW